MLFTLYRLSFGHSSYLCREQTEPPTCWGGAA